MYDLLIQNADVLRVDPDGSVSVKHGHDVAVTGDRIAEIAPTRHGVEAREVLSGRGMVAMPGLINCHAHVPMVIFRGLAEDVSLEKWFNEYMWPLESNLEEEDVYWGMLLGLAEMIEAGVTSVADHYFFMDQAARAVQEAGTRAALGWAVFGNQGLDRLDRTVEFTQKWQGAADGRITTWLAPHAPYTCDDAFLRACVERAAQVDTGIHIHVAETVGQTNAHLEKRGITPIQLLDDLGVLSRPSLLAHAIGATPEDIELLARRPTGIAHCPKTYLKLAMGIAPVVEFRNAGVPVGLGTDGAVSNNTLDVWESLRLMAMTQKERHGTPEVMTVAEALYIATRGSAKVIGQEHDLGALEPGYLADIILVSMEGPHCRPLHNIPATLVYATRASDVHTVVANGKVIMRDRQLLTLDRTAISLQVNDAMKRLARRVPDQRIQVYRP